MSVKRQATTELNHDNWDQEDSTEPEEMGTFKTAAKEVLEKRVIKTAKRRSQISSDESKKGVFSGFGGFNKAPPSSFDFLANLTNGNKFNNGESTTKSDTPISSSVFTNKSLSSSPNTGIFSMSGSPSFSQKPALTKSDGSLFGGFTTNATTPMKSVFSTTKADSTVTDSPFKLQASPSSVESDSAAKAGADVPKPQGSSIFGAQSDLSSSKTLFGSSSTTEKSKLFSVSNTNTSLANNTTTSKAESNTTDANSKPDQNEEKKLKYYSKLKGLNESVSDWIKKHVEETPLCILTPIFKDYEKYLREIQEEYKGGENNVKDSEKKVESNPPSNETKDSPANSKSSTGIFGNIITNSPKTEITQSNSSSGVENKTSSFNFGVSSSAVSTTGNAGFSFGIKSVQSTASSLFSVSTSSTTSASTPFSFGMNNTPFSFNPSNQQKTEAPEAKEEDDEPPKVEYTPIVEENSVFDKKCKIFIKKDGNFVDKGVGTLYIKKIEESGKHQLLVRANTNLGTVLLNFILSSSIPTQRMGKNNVMLVCIPTPDAKPPPTPILIRVKTTEEADELLNTLDKYKA